MRTNSCEDIGIVLALRLRLTKDLSYIIRPVLDYGGAIYDQAYSGQNNAWSSDMTERICHLIGHKFSQF